ASRDRGVLHGGRAGHPPAVRGSLRSRYLLGKGTRRRAGDPGSSSPCRRHPLDRQHRSGLGSEAPLKAPDQDEPGGGGGKMRRMMLMGKVHRATVTDANLNYEGSLTLDPDLMEAAGMLPYEQVQVLDVDNGARLTTYLI